MDNVYTIDEAKERCGHPWDTIKSNIILDYDDDHLFEKIGHEIAAVFAKKRLSINCHSGETYHRFNYENYNSIPGCEHNARYALLQRVHFYFNKKCGQKKIKTEDLRYFCQMDSGFYWLFVTDKKTGNSLIFEAI